MPAPGDSTCRMAAWTDWSRRGGTYVLSPMWKRSGERGELLQPLRNFDIPFSSTSGEEALSFADRSQGGGRLRGHWRISRHRSDVGPADLGGHGLVCRWRPSRLPHCLDCASGRAAPCAGARSEHPARIERTGPCLTESEVDRRAAGPAASEIHEAIVCLQSAPGTRRPSNER